MADGVAAGLVERWVESLGPVPVAAVEAALLVETDTRSSKIVAERIRSKIENFDFSTGADHTGRLTATVGHATYPIHATTKDEIIELADKAMYLGKHDRNVSRSASEINDRQSKAP